MLGLNNLTIFIATVIAVGIGGLVGPAILGTLGDRLMGAAALGTIAFFGSHAVKGWMGR